MALWQPARKDRKRLEPAQRRAQEWQVLMERAELLERQHREQRELLRRLGQEPRELRAGQDAQLRELDRRHNRERQEMGCPPGGGTRNRRRWFLCGKCSTPTPGQVGISLSLPFNLCVRAGP
jgi:hypothetical protein